MIINACVYAAGLVLVLCLNISCMSSAPYSINSKESSEAVNRNEGVRYKQALLRCHKTGGTRIVKIDGVLRCF